MKKSMVFLFLLLMFSSCNDHVENFSLLGRKYVNEKTLDQIEFIRRGKVGFTWISDNYHIPHWDKNNTYKFTYQMSEKGNIHVILPAAWAGFFPYKTLRLSDSKDRIIVTRYDGRKELFLKVVSTGGSRREH